MAGCVRVTRVAGPEHLAEVLGESLDVGGLKQEQDGGVSEPRVRRVRDEGVDQGGSDRVGQGARDDAGGGEASSGGKEAAGVKLENGGESQG